MMGCVCHLRIYNTVLNVKFNFAGELRVFVHFMCVCVYVWFGRFFSKTLISREINLENAPR